MLVVAVSGRKYFIATSASGKSAKDLVSSKSSRLKGPLKFSCPIMALQWLNTVNWTDQQVNRVLVNSPPKQPPSSIAKFSHAKSMMAQRLYSGRVKVYVSTNAMAGSNTADNASGGSSSLYSSSQEVVVETVPSGGPEPSESTPASFEQTEQHNSADVKAQAGTLQRAAEKGAPFCEICEKKRRGIA